ncbi:SET domain-containing protein [Cesiribacter andamanensis]|uniref:SET domain protein n=1 Tax=Cesiribacter andamanensis AMV16 TaxID=1279009 RepID=M7NBF5_9BACT|nr:SET domain-containing protein-lysine N-methyltransferase [Cesiribacter andamanensis]EMR04602.1 SET domain protein [Cesiribacter andamanensis AMV16]
MIHPDIELRYINDAIGYGVFAKKRIPEGTITYIRDSLEIEVAPADFQKHPPVMQQAIDKYSYIDERGYRIVSWDIAKYVNHCCQCNTISTGWGFEFAIRDIEAGEQITDEYGIFNLEREMEVFCGNSQCRKVIRPDDFDRLYPQWDARIQQSMKKFEQVAQPLLPLMDAQIREELEQYLADPSHYKSVYSLRLQGQTASQLFRNNGSR